MAALAIGACGAPGAHAEKSAGGSVDAYLKAASAEKGAVTLPSGLIYRVLRSGPAGGVAPRPGDQVKVHYEGALTDGTVFDSSYERGAPAVFEVGELVPGWNEALQRMRPGDSWRIVLPSDLAYGDAGAGPIPPGAVLVFRMELIDVLPRDGRRPR